MTRTEPLPEWLHVGAHVGVITSLYGEVWLPHRIGGTDGTRTVTSVNPGGDVTISTGETFNTRDRSPFHDAYTLGGDGPYRALHVVQVPSEWWALAVANQAMADWMGDPTPRAARAAIAAIREWAGTESAALTIWRRDPVATIAALAFTAGETA